MNKLQKFSLVVTALAVSSLSFGQKDLIISGGSAVSSLVCSNNYVFVTGSNKVQAGSGTLGVGSTADKVTQWTRVNFPGNITIQQVNSGSGQSFVALACESGDATVWCWGDNLYGQCGQGAKGGIVTEPKQVVAGCLAGTSYDCGGYLCHVSVVYAGNANSFAILGEGEYEGYMVAWGGNLADNNFTSCLGTGSNAGTAEPTWCVDLNGKKMQNVIRIFSGDDATLALDSDGHVWSCGGSQKKETGLGRKATGGYSGTASNGGPSNAFGMVYVAAGKPLSNIKEIAAGDVAYFALDADGYIWSWGDTWNHAAGQGANKGSNSPQKVVKGTVDDEDSDGTYLLAKSVGAGQSSGMAVSITGKPVTWGANPGNGTATAAEAPGYVQYAAGKVHSDVILINKGDNWGFYGLSDGSMYAWGDNSNGQLGIGNTTAQTYAKKINPPSDCNSFKDPHPAAAITPKSMMVCQSAFEGVTLNCGFAVSAADLLSSYRITWYKDGVQVQQGNATKTTYKTKSGPDGMGTYKVVIEYVGTNAGCDVYEPSEDEITIAPLEKTFDVDDFEFCNNTVTAKVTTTNTKAVYSWWGTSSGTGLLGKSVGNASTSLDVSGVAYDDAKKTTKTIYVQETALGLGNFISANASSWSDGENLLDGAGKYYTGFVAEKDVVLNGFTFHAKLETKDYNYQNVTDDITASATFTVTIYAAQQYNGGFIENTAKKIGSMAATVTWTWEGQTGVKAANGSFENIEITGTEISLPAGTYFIGLSASNATTNAFQAIKATKGGSSLGSPTDDVDGTYMSFAGVSGYGSPNQQSTGYFSNISFSTGPGFCDLIPVKLTENCPCNKPGEFTLVADDDLLCPDESATISLKQVKAPDNANKVVYEWYKGTTKLSNDNQKTYSTTEAGTYILKAYDSDNPASGSCQFTAEIEIKDAPKPTVTIGEGGDYCSNKTVNDIALTFTGTAPFSYTYTENGGTAQSGTAATTAGKIVPSTAIAAKTASKEYVYKIASVTDANGCVADAYNTTATVTIVGVPTATITPSAEEVCAPNTITLTASSDIAGSTFKWSDKGSGVSETQTASGAGSYNYSLVAINTVGTASCESEKVSQEVVIDAKPVVTLSSDKTAVCSGETINLTATAKIGSAAATGGKYTWTNATGTSATSTVSKEAEWSSGAEEVIVKVDYETAAGCKADQSDPLTLTFNPAPNAPAESNKASYCMDPSRADVTLEATADKNCTLQWYEKDGTTKLSKAPSINVKAKAEYNYNVTQIYEGCESEPTPITIVVNEKLQPKIEINSNELCIGGTTDVTVQDANKYNVTWSGTAATSGFGATSTSKTPTFTAPSVTSATDYIVHVYVKNDECDGENEATITVHPTPTVTLAASPASICDGVSSTITATISGDDNKGTQTAYTWKNATETDKTKATVTGANTTATDKTETVTYSYTSSHGCKATDATTTVTMLATPVAPTTEAYTKCLDATAETLDTYVSKYTGTLNWYESETATSTISTPDGATNKVISPAKNYYVSQTIAGCESAKSPLPVTINANLEPVITTTETSGNADNDGVVCQGTAITLSTGGNYKETWTSTTGSSYLQVTSNSKTFLGTAPAGTYTINLEVEDANGCKGNGTVDLTVNSIPLTSLSVDKPANCISVTDAQTITATITGDAGTGTWGGEVTNTANTTADFIPSANAASDYTITYDFVSDAGCEAAQSTQTMTVYALPTPQLTLSNKVVCHDGTTNKDVVTVTTKNTVASGTFAYSIDKGTVDASTGAFDPTANDAGEYEITLTYTDLNGCVNTTSDKLNVYDKPSVSIDGSDEACYNAGAATPLSPVVSPTGGTGKWTGTASATSASFIPKSYPEGDNTVGYTYTDPNGCTNSTEKTINVVKVSAPTTSGTSTVMINLGVVLSGSSSEMTATAANANDKLQWFEGENGSTGTKVGSDGDASYEMAVDGATTESGAYPYTVRSYRTVDGKSCYSDSAIARVVVTTCSAMSPEASDIYICTNDPKSTTLTAVRNANSTISAENSLIAWLDYDPVTGLKPDGTFYTSKDADNKSYTPTITTPTEAKDFPFFVAEYDRTGDCWSAATKVTIHYVEPPVAEFIGDSDFCAKDDDVVAIEVNPKNGTLSFAGTPAASESLSGFNWTPGDYSGAELSTEFKYTVVSDAYADGTTCKSEPTKTIKAHYMAPLNGSQRTWLITLPSSVPDLSSYTESTLDPAYNSANETIKWYSSSRMTNEIGTGEKYDVPDLKDSVGTEKTYSSSYWVTRTLKVSEDLSCESVPAEVKLDLMDCPWSAPTVSDITICSGNPESKALTLVGTPGDLSMATGGATTGWRWYTAAQATDTAKTTAMEYATGLAETVETTTVTEYKVSYKAQENESKAECWSPETTVKVTVNANPVVEIQPIGNSVSAGGLGVLCYDGGTFMATAKVNDVVTSGGSWTMVSTGANVLKDETSGIIEPTNSLDGGNPADGEYSIKYAYTDGNGCYGEDTESFWVEYAETPITAKYLGIAQEGAENVTVIAKNIDKEDTQVETIVNWYKTENASKVQSTGETWEVTLLDPTEQTDGEVTFYVSQEINGCTSARAPQVIELVACPWVVESVVDDETCEGIPVNGMTATAMETYEGSTVNPEKWSWSTNEDLNVIAGQVGTESTYKQENVTAIGATTYAVKYYAAYDKANYEYATIEKSCWSAPKNVVTTVFKNPTVTFAENTSAVCYTDGAIKINVTVNLSGDDNYLNKYTWSTTGSDESFTTEEQSYAYFNTLAQNEETNTYDILLNVTDKHGCTNATTVNDEKRTIKVVYLPKPETIGFYGMTSQENPVQVKIDTKNGFSIADGAVIHWFGDATTMSDSEKKNKNLDQATDKGATWETGDAYNRTVERTYYARQYDASATCYSLPTPAVVKIVPCPIPNVIVDAPEACIYDVANGATAMTVSTGTFNEGEEAWTERDAAKSEFRFYKSTSATDHATTLDGVKYDPKDDITAAGVYSYYVSEYNSLPLQGLTNPEGCESPKVKTTVTAKETAKPAITPESDAVCEGENSKLNFKSTLNSSASAAIWFEEDPGAYGIPEIEGSAKQINYTPIKDTPGEYTIYAVRYEDDCYSEKVTAQYTIKPIPDAPEVTDASICFEEANITVSAEGSSEDAMINWYADEKATKSLSKNSKTYLSKETEPETYEYFATQVVNGCESSLRMNGVTKALYTIKELPLPPQVDYKTSLCEYDDNQVLVASGEDIDSVKWYIASDMENPVAEYTSEYTVTDEMMQAGVKRFYATRTVNGCEGPTKLISFNVYVKPETPKTVGASICQGDTVLPTLSTNLSIDKWWADSLMETYVTTGYTYTPLVSEVGNKDLVYYITRTQNNCTSDTVPVTLHVIKTPTLTIHDDTIACVYDDVIEIKAENFTPAMNAESSVKWQILKNGINKAVADGENHSITPTDVINEANDYTIYATYKYVSDGIFCSSEPVSMSYIVKERARTPIVFSKTICQGTEIKDLQALGSMNIEWTSLNENVQPQKYHGPLFHFQPGQTLDTGTYYFEIYDLNVYDDSDAENVLGCESIRDTVEMIVAPGAHTKLFGRDSVCLGSIGESYYTQYEKSSLYYWSVSGNNLNYSKDANATSVRYVDWMEPGVDTLVVYEQTWAGCEGYDTLIVNIAPAPVAFYTWTMPGASNIIELKDSSYQDSLWTTDQTGAPFAKPIQYTMAWNFGHQGVPESQIDTVIPYSKRNYAIQEGNYLYGYNCPILTVTNDFGCKSTYSECVFVNIASSVYVPTAFSPTNPAHSVRTFQPKGFNLQSCEISVYDKWGNLLWFSNEVEDGMFVGYWDGRYDGKMMKSDVYIWKMEATFLDGQKWQGFDAGNGKKTKYGSVTLIR